MKEWFAWHWKGVLWAVGLILFGLVIIKFNYYGYDWSKEAQVKTKEVCIKAAKTTFGLDLEDKEAKLVPIGTTTVYANRKGHMIVWQDENGQKISCVSSHKQGSTFLENFYINGEDKTELVRREERKK